MKTQLRWAIQSHPSIHPFFGVHVKLSEDLWVFIRGILTEYLLILIVVNSSMIINLNVYTRTFFLFSSSTWLISLEKKYYLLRGPKMKCQLGGVVLRRHFQRCCFECTRCTWISQLYSKYTLPPGAFCCQCLWKVYMFLSFTILLKFTLHSTYSIQTGNLIYNVAF